jgi:hypothetical protein
VRRKRSVVQHEVDSRAGREGGQPFQQLDGLEQQRRRPIGPLGLEREENAAVGGAREALLCNRRPQNIAAQLLKRLAIVRRDGDVGVQVEAVVSMDSEKRGNLICVSASV